MEFLGDRKMQSAPHRPPSTSKADQMETLCKLYLELANIVPKDCVSSREIDLKRYANTYGLALRMIAEGCADPREVAGKALMKIHAETA